MAVSNVIDYVQMSTLGNAADFGDLTVARYYCIVAGGYVRFIVGGGTTGSLFNTIDYGQFSTLGNAADFGDFTMNKRSAGAVTNGIRSLFAGGDDA